MEWVFGIATTVLAGLNVFQFVFWKSTKKEYEAKASQAETEANDARHDFLVKRIESMEKMYNQQGEILDGLREKVLKLSEEKLASNQRIQQLESENKALTAKVEKLEAEVEAYKTITKNGKA
jgi:chromosome segregation ATPase